MRSVLVIITVIMPRLLSTRTPCSIVSFFQVFSKCSLMWTKTPKGNRPREKNEIRRGFLVAIIACYLLPASLFIELRSANDLMQKDHISIMVKYTWKKWFGLASVRVSASACFPSLETIFQLVRGTGLRGRNQCFLLSPLSYFTPKKVWEDMHTLNRVVMVFSPSPRTDELCQCTPFFLRGSVFHRNTLHVPGKVHQFQVLFKARHFSFTTTCRVDKLLPRLGERCSRNNRMKVVYWWNK